MIAMRPPEDEEVCGETYDHDLEDTGSSEGWTTYICRRCGGEIQEGPEDGTDSGE